MEKKPEFSQEDSEQKQYDRSSTKKRTRTTSNIDNEKTTEAFS
jgi:hypothetical protein